MPWAFHNRVIMMPLLFTRYANNKTYLSVVHACTHSYAHPNRLKCLFLFYIYWFCCTFNVVVCNVIYIPISNAIRISVCRALVRQRQPTGWILAFSLIWITSLLKTRIYQRKLANRIVNGIAHHILKWFAVGLWIVIMNKLPLQWCARASNMWK